MTEPPPSPRLLRAAIVFRQFAPYHYDRIAAAAKRLSGRWEVVGIELASSSRAYAWPVTSDAPDVETRRLFPGERVERLSFIRRLLALGRAVADCDAVLMGIPYSDPALIGLSWWLRSRGSRVFVMTESKVDDAPRRAWREWGKRCVLGA